MQCLIGGMGTALLLASGKTFNSEEEVQRDMQHVNQVANRCVYEMASLLKESLIEDRGDEGAAADAAQPRAHFDLTTKSQRKNMGKLIAKTEERIDRVKHGKTAYYSNVPVS